jgi:FMN phosphatase YigB (HAD superfamily)
MGNLGDIDVVLFDLGGTLVDYPIPRWPVMVGQCAHAVYDYLVSDEGRRRAPPSDVPDPAEAHARRPRALPGAAWPHRVMMALRRVVRSLSGRTLPRLAEACARPVIAPGHLFDDTLPTLRALRDRGYRLGLVSNTPWGTPGYLWTGQLERFSLAPLLEVAVFSSDVGFRKPDPRIFHLALDRMGAEADRTLFVGDTPEADIVGGRRVGFRTALVMRGVREAGSASPAADLRLESLADLLEHLPPKSLSG